MLPETNAASEHDTDWIIHRVVANIVKPVVILKHIPIWITVLKPDAFIIHQHPAFENHFRRRRDCRNSGCGNDLSDLFLLPPENDVAPTYQPTAWEMAARDLMFLICLPIFLLDTCRMWSRWLGIESFEAGAGGAFGHPRCRCSCQTVSEELQNRLWIRSMSRKWSYWNVSSVGDLPPKTNNFQMKCKMERVR